MGNELWKPSEQRISDSLMAKFMRETGVGLASGRPDFEALWRFSVDRPADFWNAVWDFCGIVGDKGNTVIRKAERIMDTRFFPDARLNFAENLLKHRGGAPAIIWHGEGGGREEWSWDDLVKAVSRLQQALRAEGVGPGDRVAGYLP
ncbi:MAG: acetyl-coenzyme A synthetase N-terminal domain-containing protein, partial [Paracoccaceae bacterium]